ncbi:hypothetical protein [Brevundimonas sp. A19_0]|uniref:hypothetical protein n=1 Tax=Brevundimonas sp. A19_0 TaxID=2821087 RepID=UPI001ADA7748|nr:hypothetical protein [Brevundimonas sp. A19_0]MBO9501692.1 hypothetical protein [Brevundimonas sp. A19_0]
MIGLMIVSLLLGAGGLASPRQDPGGDWDHAVAADNASSVASVGYSNGLVIEVTCYGGSAIGVEVTGLPPAIDEASSVTLSRADGRATTIPASVRVPGRLGVEYDERMARVMRGGGELSMRVERGQSSPVVVRVDLPEQHANLDQVIESCGRRLNDPRDALPILTELNAVPRATFPPARRSRTGSSDWARVEISCVVSGETRLADCQVNQQDGGNDSYGTAVARAYNGAGVDVDDPSAATGKVVYVVVTGVTARR